MSISSPPALRWHYQCNSHWLTECMCQQFASLAADAITQRGSFSVVLAGGETPQPLYRELAKLPADWSRWQVYFGDERCLPQGSPDRNDTMARLSWLNTVPLPAENIHPIAAERLQQGAMDYAALIADVPCFDLVLLGLGEDGHTASLFPNHWPDAQTGLSPVLFVSDAPKKPAQRITLSATRLGNAQSLWVLATGQQKKEALRDLRDGRNALFARIVGQRGMDIFTDQLLD